MVGSNWLKRVVLSVLIGFALPPWSATGQEPEPPSVGPVVVEDVLTTPGTLPNGRTPTGRCSLQDGAEGRLMTVAGKCVDTSTSAARGVDVRGVTFRDGEVRLDVRVMSAFERAQFIVQTRSVTGSNWHFATIRPGLGEVIFGKTVDREDTVFGHRTDLQDLLSPDGWNSVVVRSRGADHWLLINDQPVLFASDGTFDAGGLTLSLRRLGDPNDDEEVAVVLKNLRLSTLADGDPARAPSFVRP